MPTGERDVTHKVKDAVTYVNRGITDNYLLEENEGFCERAENVIIDTSRKIRPHPGTRLINRGKRTVKIRQQGEEVEVQVPGTLPHHVNSSTPIDALYPFADKFLIAFSGGFLFYYDEDREIFEQVEIQGQTRLRVFPRGSEFTFGEYNNEVIICSGELERPFLLYFDTAGRGLPNGHYLELPKPSVAGDALPLSPDTPAHKYAFIFVRSYESSNYEKEDRGDVTYLRNLPDSDRMRTFTFPATPGITANHGNLKIEIYRTQFGRTAYYKIGEVPYAPGATFTDNMASTSEEDQRITTGARLYADTEPQREPPPLARYVAAGGGRIYLSNIQDSIGQVRNRTMYSQPGIVYGFPEANLIDIDFDITGLGFFKNNAIVFTLFTAHRMESVGGSAITPYEFENVSGCIAPLSVVSITEGVFYASHDGIYMTDGFKAIKLSDHITETYSRIPNKERIFAFYDAPGDRIYFFYERYSVSTGLTSFSEALVLDLLHSTMQKNGGCFTTYTEFTGLSHLEKNLYSRAWASFKRETFRGNADSTISKVDPTFFDREVLDFREGRREIRVISGWVDFISGGLTYGHHAILKKIARLIVLARARSNGALQFFVIDDGGKAEARPSVYEIDTIVEFLKPGFTGADLNKVGSLPLIPVSKKIGGNGSVININQVGFHTAPRTLYKDITFTIEFYRRRSGRTPRIVMLSAPRSDFARVGEYPLLDLFLKIKDFVYPVQPDDYRFINNAARLEIPIGPTEYDALPREPGTANRIVYEEAERLTCFRILAVDGTDKTHPTELGSNAPAIRYTLRPDTDAGEDHVRLDIFYDTPFVNFATNGDRLVLFLDGGRLRHEDISIPNAADVERGVFSPVPQAMGRDVVCYRLEARLRGGAGDGEVPFTGPQRQVWRYNVTDDDGLGDSLEVTDLGNRSRYHYEIITAEPGDYDLHMESFSSELAPNPFPPAFNFPDRRADISMQILGQNEGDENFEIINYQLYRRSNRTTGGLDFWEDATYEKNGNVGPNVTWRNPAPGELHLEITDPSTFNRNAIPPTPPSGGFPGTPGQPADTLDQWMVRVWRQPIPAPVPIPDVPTETRGTLNRLVNQLTAIRQGGQAQYANDEWQLQIVPDLEVYVEDLGEATEVANSIQLTGTMDLLKYQGMDFELLDISMEGEANEPTRRG